MQTREQEYAAKIYKQIEDEVKGKSFQDDYKTSAKNLAFLIRSAGLVQALYFTDSRLAKLVEHLAVVVEKRETNQTIEQHKNGFLKKVRESNINEYIFLTEKCLLALKWYKRCVDIHIKDKEERNSTGSEVEKDDHEA